MRIPIFLLLLLTVAVSFTYAQNVGIGTNSPAASALLHINSTTKGLLMPRLTTTQRNAISSPANGLQVYDTNTNSFWYFNSSIWVELAAGGGGSSSWNINDTNIYNNNSGRVGIGTSTPLAKLSVVGTGQWGTASFTGSTRTTHINYGSEQHTYIRGGKAGSNVIISDDDGNVGIGTPNPYNKLEVAGKISAAATAMSTSINGLSGGVLSVTNTDGNGQTMTIDGSNIQSSYYGINGQQYLPVVVNPFGGNVGIGTNYTPSRKLEIYRGRLLFAGAQDAANGIHPGIEFTNDNANFLSGFVGMANDNNIGFYGYGGAGFGLIMNVYNGNVGVNTITPKSKLDVNGSFSLPIRKVVAAGSYAITDEDYTIIADLERDINKTINLTLPSAINRKGRIYNIVAVNVESVDFNSLTGLVNIYNDGPALLTTLAYKFIAKFSPYEVTEAKTTFCTVQSDGAQWYITASDNYYYSDTH
jgi:hypothetical protein